AVFASVRDSEIAIVDVVLGGKNVREFDFPPDINFIRSLEGGLSHFKRQWQFLLVGVCAGRDRCGNALRESLIWRHFEIVFRRDILIGISYSDPPRDIACLCVSDIAPMWRNNPNVSGFVLPLLESQTHSRLQLTAEKSSLIVHFLQLPFHD